MTMKESMTFKIEVMRNIRRRYFGSLAAYEIRVDQIHWLYSPKGTVYHGALTESKSSNGKLAVDRMILKELELHLIPFSDWWVANWHYGKRS